MSLILMGGAPVHAVDTAASGATDELVERERRRLEDLFISKMAEELKLPAKVEPSFTKAMQALNREKARANTEIVNALAALEKAQSAGRSVAPKKSKQAPTSPEMAKALKRYERAVKVYGELPLREISRLRKILGVEKLSSYLLAKSQMAEKLKALSAHESALNTPAVVAPSPTP